MAKKNNRSIFYLHLVTGNTPSGNPQRLYVLFNSESGRLEEVIDEGYTGLPEKLRYPNGIELMTIEVPKSVYHSLKNGREMYGTRVSGL